MVDLPNLPPAKLFEAGLAVGKVETFYPLSYNRSTGETLTINELTNLLVDIDKLGSLMSNICDILGSTNTFSNQIKRAYDRLKNITPECHRDLHAELYPAFNLILGLGDLSSHNIVFNMGRLIGCLSLVPFYKKNLGKDMEKSTFDKHLSAIVERYRPNLSEDKVNAVATIAESLKWPVQQLKDGRLPDAIRATLAEVPPADASSEIPCQEEGKPPKGDGQLQPKTIRLTFKWFGSKRKEKIPSKITGTAEKFVITRPVSDEEIKTEAETKTKTETEKDVTITFPAFLKFLLLWSASVNGQGVICEKDKKSTKTGSVAYRVATDYLDIGGRNQGLPCSSIIKSSTSTNVQTALKRDALESITGMKKLLDWDRPTPTKDRYVYWISKKATIELIGFESALDQLVKMEMAETAFTNTTVAREWNAHRKEFVAFIRKAITRQGKTTSPK